MSNAVALVTRDIQAVEAALVKNDIGKLGDNERMAYYKSVCDSVGLNPMTKPFAFLTLQGRTVLYATKDCTEQLRKIHGVSIQIISQAVEGDLFVVHVKAKDRTGREDEDISAIPLNNAKGEALANMRMKGLTKAKRRVTLSICGLGILDESELDTLAGKFEPSSNPQIENPFQKDDIPENTLPAPKLDLGEFVCAIGVKHKGKKLSDFDIFELDNYVNWLKNSAQQKGQSLTGAFLDFVETAESYLASREVGADSAADHI